MGCDSNMVNNEKKKTIKSRIWKIIGSYQDIMKMEIFYLEQKYMEYIHAGKTYEALKVSAFSLSSISHFLSLYG